MSKHSNSLFILLLVFSLAACTSVSFEDNDDVVIYRDEWGVPHIHGKTDAAVAYGLAWATCEDDFVTVQEQMMAIRGKYGEYKGKEGLIADFAIHFMDIRSYAQENYQKELSEKVKSVLQSYTDGANAYAKIHPDQVLLSSIFPIQVEDVIAGYLLGLVEISGAGEDLRKILDGGIIADLKSNFPKGSNAIAMNGHKTDGNQTFLAINSHQPLEGWYSWYEAHLISDESTNILGGTFPGGSLIFHGTNEYLGWAHTVNHADFSDVFKLNTDPDDDMRYEVDGEWKTLRSEKVWAWMKVAGPIKIPIRRVKYFSVFGPTFITDQGVFAWSYAAHKAIKSVDQWYAMNKAKSYGDFKKALEIQGIPCTNIVYADRDQNIYYISNAKIPYRDRRFNWREVLRGDTTVTLPSLNYYPLDSLPQVYNPQSGYVFNTNNTPYSSTDSLENPKRSTFNEIAGFFEPYHENNRSLRFLELMNHYDSLSYEDFKRVKYDRQYPSRLSQPHMINQELILDMDPKDYPDIATEIDMLNNWNRLTDLDNTTAPLFLLTLDELNKELKAKGLHKRDNEITARQCAKAIETARGILLADFDQVNPSLAKVMRHTRGEVNIPIGGGSDVLAAIYGKKQDDGTYRANAGESYIQLVQFKPNSLPTIETINAYGASAVPSSPHYTDQMELFANQQLKPMSLSLDTVIAQSVSSYHPLKIKD